MNHKLIMGCQHRVVLLLTLGIGFVLAGCAQRTPQAAPAMAATPSTAVSQPAPTQTTVAPVATPAAPPREIGSSVAARSGNTLSHGVPSATTNAWTSMFDGKSLRGWKETDFAGRGDVTVEDGKLVLGMGYMTGITWTNDIPHMNYEVEVEAMRVDGTDFFCGLTFPVGVEPCSLIVGGWGGGVVGISSLDGQDAANNETAQYMNFEKGRWYTIRLRVLPDKLQAWIDGDKVVDVATTGRQISIRAEVEPSRPFGFSTWSTTGALRNIRFRKL